MSRYEVCDWCKAVGYGNATCSACVRQWPRLGLPQQTVDRLLEAIGDRLPEPPFGTRFN